MKKMFAVIAAMTALATPLSAAPCKQADAKLAGSYELTGVMETGSVIILAADGRFGYMLTVGAFEEIGRGCWHRKNDVVILKTSDIKANNGKPSFKELSLKLDAKGGLIRFHKSKQYGTYVRYKK